MDKNACGYGSELELEYVGTGNSTIYLILVCTVCGIAVLSETYILRCNLDCKCCVARR